jgi:UPF0271 protein
LAGFDPFSVNDKQATVPKVRDEIKGNSIAMLRFNTAVDNAKVKVKEPSKDFWYKARASAKKLGDSFFLSETDLQILALALELREEGCIPTILTDDYSIQNVATEIGIDFASLSTYGIKRLLEWRRYCPACYKEYHADYNSNVCSVCGTILKRKPRRKINSLKMLKQKRVNLKKRSP